MKPLKRSISITLDEDVLAEIKMRAEEDERSVSQYINLVLRTVCGIFVLWLIFCPRQRPWGVPRQHPRGA